MQRVGNEEEKKLTLFEEATNAKLLAALRATKVVRVPGLSERVDALLDEQGWVRK